MQPCQSLSGDPCEEHIQPVLCKEHWLPVEYQTRFKVLFLTFKPFMVWKQCIFRITSCGISQESFTLRKSELSGDSQPKRHLAPLRQSQAFSAWLLPDGKFFLMITEPCGTYHYSTDLSHQAFGWEQQRLCSLAHSL